MSCILYQMVVAVLFSWPFLCIQPPLQSPPKICPPTSAFFCLTVPPLLVPKIILIISTNTLLLSTSAIVLLPTFAYSRPYNLHYKLFPYFSNLSNLDCVKGPLSEGVCGDWHCFNPSLLPQSIDWDSRAHNHWFLITSSLWWRYLQ